MIKYDDNASVSGMPIFQHGPRILGKSLLIKAQEADSIPHSHLQTHSACSAQSTRQKPRSHDAVLISLNWPLVIVSFMRADSIIQPWLP